mmetsp:Transcript_11044/g.27881  ORF Transcript_11044/g.27881 Transcript_11044/m.27881 type:complete len:240 (-) Transcript_11044:1027-1746(-)
MIRVPNAKFEVRLASAAAAALQQEESSTVTSEQSGDSPPASVTASCPAASTAALRSAAAAAALLAKLPAFTILTSAGTAPCASTTLRESGCAQRLPSVAAALMRAARVEPSETSCTRSRTMAASARPVEHACGVAVAEAALVASRAACELAWDACTSTLAAALLERTTECTAGSRLSIFSTSAAVRCVIGSHCGLSMTRTSVSMAPSLLSTGSASCGRRCTSCFTATIATCIRSGSLVC